MMDPRTRAYYQTHAETVAARFASVGCPFKKYHALAFPAGARVLDVGAGVGREVAALVSEGYVAYGVEPVEELRGRAARYFPQIAGRLVAGSLPEEMPSAEALGGPFDGILCSAVLQHVPRSRMFDTVFALKGLLRERGRALVSVPAARPGVVEERDGDGRLFTGITADELELLFERAGFASIGRWDGEDAGRRPGFAWVTVLFELRSAGESRPIDRVEAVLSTREKKVATYKLALIRALAAIAQTESHRARFGRDGMVRVPMAAIAERWIDYYWPLFDAGADLLPQMNGEWRAGAHKLGFAKELAALIGTYRRQGGMSGFAVDRRSGRMQGAATAQHRALVTKLRSTIRAGPVTYAGGAQGERMFGYERGDVLVAADLWRELSLMGHWIQEALILRWAELVSRLSSGEVTVDRVVARLLVAPEPARETAAARDVYLELSALECVWTGSTIRHGQLAVDHVLPYSMWRNNDLWNLLPTLAKVNGSKRDRLPSRRLLRGRRDAIVGCWEVTRNRLPARFAHEAAAQTGDLAASRSARADVDLARLFDALSEAVEVTAIQRACPRWEP